MATSLGAFTETGTVTDHRDLMLKIKVFGESLGWTTKRHLTPVDVNDNHELIMETTNGFLLGLKEINDDVLDVYNFELQSFTFFDNAKSFHEQSGAIPYKGINGFIKNSFGAKQLGLTNQPMTYWLNFSQDKMLIVAKIGTSYCSAYLGKFKAYGSPLQYPNPKFVGGHLSASQNINTPRYSDNNGFNSSFIFGIADSDLGTSAYSAMRYFVTLPDNNWEQLTSNSGTSTPPNIGDNSKYFNINNNKCFTYGFGFAKENAIYIKESLSNENEYKIPMIIKNDSLKQAQSLGEFFSCGLVVGASLLPEDTFTIDAEDYIVFPDVFRNNTYDFWAMKID